MITTIIMVITALAVHEAAHVLAANYLGGKVSHVRPFLLGFSAKINGLEKLRAWERYVIYFAGAAANFIVAAWAFTVHHLSYVGVDWLNQLALYSLVLGIFNLIPALPLDGGRVFQQFLGNIIGVLRANRVILWFGRFFAIFLGVLGVVQIILYSYNITLLCAAIYIWHKNKKINPELQLEFFNAMEGKYIQDRARKMPIKQVSLPDSTSVSKALSRLTLDHYMVFDIKKEHIHENALLKYVFDNGLHGTLDDVLEPAANNGSAE